MLTPRSLQTPCWEKPGRAGTESWTRDGPGTAASERDTDLHRQIASRCRWSSCPAPTGRLCWPAPPAPGPWGPLQEQRGRPPQGRKHSNACICLKTEPAALWGGCAMPPGLSKGALAGSTLLRGAWWGLAQSTNLTSGPAAALTPDS